MIKNTTIEFKVLDKKIGKKIPLPKEGTIGSAGLDLRVCLNKPKKIYPGKTILIPTGIAIYLNDPNIAGLILPRSGLGHKHGIVLGNLVGLIDSDYQGEIMISCWNRGEKIFFINPGYRIAQLIIVPIIKIKFKKVEKFSLSKRGIGGFGHTGLI